MARIERGKESPKQVLLQQQNDEQVEPKTNNTEKKLYMNK